MATVVITPTRITEKGVAESFQSMSTADTYKVRNDGRVLIHFKKTGAGAANVTIVTPKTVAGFALADQVVIVPATTGDVMSAPINEDVFNDASGDISFSTDDAVGLTVAALRI